MFDDTSPNGEHIALPPSEKNDRVNALGNALAQKDKRVRELETSLEDKNRHVQRLKGDVADVTNAIVQKDERVRELKVSLEDRTWHIQHLDGEVTEITNAIVQREDKIREIEIENRRINSELNSIKQSATWRTVMKWHSFIEKSIPQRTRRRSYYDLGIIGLRTITNEGWRSFWWNFKAYNRKVVRSRTKSQIVAPTSECIPEHPEECQHDTNFKKYASKTFIQTSEYNMTADREEIKKKIDAIIEEIGKER